MPVGRRDRLLPGPDCFTCRCRGAIVGFTEWFLLIVVVILIPLAIAVTVTLWSLEQARQRTKKNRPGTRRRVALPPADAAEEPPPTGSLPPATPPDS